MKTIKMQKWALETGKNDFVTDPQLHKDMPESYGITTEMDSDNVLWLEAETAQEAMQKFAALGFKGAPLSEDVCFNLFAPDGF